MPSQIDPHTQHYLHYADTFVPENETTYAVREKADELGAHPISPAVGGLLTMLTRAVNAQSVVEIGTGTGISGLYLLQGMSSHGVLTTIDIDSARQKVAKELFQQHDIPSARTRIINGSALDVIPRLADSSYHMIFIDGAIADQTSYVTEATRLLRSSGVMVINNAWGGVPASSIADTGSTADTLAQRETVQQLQDSPQLLPVYLPIGAGVLCATKSSLA